MLPLRQHTDGNKTLPRGFLRRARGRNIYKNLFYPIISISYPPLEANSMEQIGSGTLKRGNG
jgi:hypothetical protein